MQNGKKKKECEVNKGEKLNEKRSEEERKNEPS